MSVAEWSNEGVESGGLRRLSQADRWVQEREREENRTAHPKELCCIGALADNPSGH